MKRINDYKKLFQVENEIDLKELKKSYRSLVKEWHPDKFQEEEKKKGEGGLAKGIIEKDIDRGDSVGELKKNTAGKKE